MSPVPECDQEVREIFVENPLERVMDLEAEMIVFYPRCNVIVTFEFPCFAGFPPAVIDTAVYVGFFRVLAGSPRSG